VYADSLSNRGGTGIYIRRLLEGFCQCDAPVLAAINGRILSSSEALSSRCSSGGIRKVFNENFTLPRAAMKISPSIVHLPAFAGRAPNGVPCAVTIHDLAFCINPVWFPFYRSIYYRLHFKRVAEKADVVIVDSESTGRDAVSMLGVKENIVRTVYLSTDSFLTDPAEFRSIYDLDGKYIAYAGTIEPRKNIDALLESWVRVKKAHPEMTLVIAGRWGWGPRALKNRLRKMDGILLTGTLSDKLLKSCISGSELLVYPSLYEGFGLPPLEAASAGIHSVITPASALMEIYSAISTVAGGFDGDSIAEAILDALETGHDPDKLRDFARQYSSETMARNVLKIYREFEV